MNFNWYKSSGYYFFAFCGFIVLSSFNKVGSRSLHLGGNKAPKIASVSGVITTAYNYGLNVILTKVPIFPQFTKFLGKKTKLFLCISIRYLYFFSK